jgi:hypothetical protein
VPPVIPTLADEDDDPILEGSDAEDEAQTAEEKVNRGPVRGREYNVSKANRDAARKMIDGAMTLSLNGDNDKALKTLTQALRTDPNLVNDNYFSSLAATITGRDGDAAIQVIVDGSQRSQAIKAAKQEKRQRRVDKHLEVVKTSTGRAVGFEMLIFALTVIIGPVLLELVTLQTIQRFLATYVPTDAEEAAILQESLQQIVDALSFRGVAALAITAMVSAAFFLIGFLIFSIITHFIATTLLRGNGTLNHLLTTMLEYFNRWVPYYFVALCLFTGILGFIYASPLVLCLILPFSGYTLWINFDLSKNIGTAYDIGIARGCLTYILTSVALSIVMGLALLLIAQAFSTAITTFFQIPTG